jgi:SdrD B-like domain
MLLFTRIRNILTGGFIVMLTAVGMQATPGHVLAANQPQPPRTLPAWQQTVADCVTGDHFIEGRINNQPDPGCDNWSTDLYERPFNNSNQNHYYASQDLVQVSATEDANWYYFQIELYGTRSGWLDAMYGIEADVNGDGCTDWYWTSTSPTANIKAKVGYNRWGQDGVIAFYDADSDVGGAVCGQPDANWSGSGYEVLVSDQGGGAAPSGMWAMSPSGARDKIVVLAVQKKMLASKNGGQAPSGIAWRGWAEQGSRDKSTYQHHDKFNGNQAGAPYLNDRNFPIRSVYEDDTTNGLDSLNLFPVRLGAIGDTVWYDNNADGLQDSDEWGLEGMAVELYGDDGDGMFEPGMGDPLVATALTDANGLYRFANLPSARYWVALGPTWFTPTTSAVYGSITLTAGQTMLDADFGVISGGT